MAPGSITLLMLGVFLRNVLELHNLRLLFSRLTKNQHIQFKIRRMLLGNLKQNVLLAAQIYLELHIKNSC